ncbi:aminodeoxychorismate synthase component I [Lentzea sp. NPDC004789]
MHVLLIDNYDSFTYNLYQLLAEVNDTPPQVMTNDDMEAWARLDPNAIDAIVVSPGPGRPERPADFGLSRWAVTQEEIPLLGVCLGYQGMCHAAGAEVVHAPEPRHGRVSLVEHTGDDLFRGIPETFSVVRYHSLIVDRFPEHLRVIAKTDDGLPMAVRNLDRPHWGVQFHPESICTEHGRTLMANFLELAREHGLGRNRDVQGSAFAGTGGVYRLSAELLPGFPDTEETYLRLFAGQPGEFWLDSSYVAEGLSRYSIMGAASGPHGEVLTYDLPQRTLTVFHPASGQQERHQVSIFDYLGSSLRERRIRDAGLPFEFNLGYVGYLGYELKAEAGGDAVHRSDTPDASFSFSDRALVFDHVERRCWALALATAETEDKARWWIAGMRAEVDQLHGAGGHGRSSPSPGAVQTHPELRHSFDEYAKRIMACLDAIRDGESYEICLTNMMSVQADVDPLSTYRTLRSFNPAPYAAYLNFGDFAVLSSSPERFLTIDRDGVVESKPIKGTRPRSDEPDEDTRLRDSLRFAEKDRAENLMIVDLVRNDLGRTAVTGSVHVPKIFDVESYRTVHQLVSTVRSKLSPASSPIDCIRAAFPGGSMTGAPKKRTMQIIDDLEGGARGVYSGSLGYLSLNGSVDMSIVIRTMVVQPGKVTLGVGGAIVAQSDVEEEIEETRVKARALIAALNHELSTPARGRFPMSTSDVAG